MMFPWFEAHKGSYQVEFKDITKEWEMYAVQGPRSIEMVNALVKNPVDNQKFFEMKANEIDGIPVYVNRAGFTGEKLVCKTWHGRLCSEKAAIENQQEFDRTQEGFDAMIEWLESVYSSK